MVDYKKSMTKTNYIKIVNFIEDYILSEISMLILPILFLLGGFLFIFTSNMFTLAIPLVIWFLVFMMAIFIKRYFVRKYNLKYDIIMGEWQEL